jgi:hypothetical protein
MIFDPKIISKVSLFTIWLTILEQQEVKGN